MRIDPSGWPFVLGGLILGIIVFWLLNPLAGVALLILSTFFLFFFRDPDRAINAPDSAVLSPADGRVMVAGAPTGQQFPADRWQQISIFLSPMDVHVNRMPVSGRVTQVKYHPGRFLPAYRGDAGDLNEYTEVTRRPRRARPSSCGRSSASWRAASSAASRKGDMVKAGDRFGVMKFGSRMDIFLPQGSTLHATVGEKVVGGVTVMATLPEGGPPWMMTRLRVRD